MLDWLNFEEFERNENLPLSLSIWLLEFESCPFAQFAAKLKICTESTSLQSRRTWTVKDWVKIGDLKARGDDETLLWASNVAVNEKFATGFDTATLRGFKLSR